LFGLSLDQRPPLRVFAEFQEAGTRLFE
jgi:hypothetical protein